MSRGIKRKIYRARKRINDRIAASTDRTNLYSRGLASEGYLGGYRDCLEDILLVLNGVNPNRSWDVDFWKE